MGFDEAQGWGVEKLLARLPARKVGSKLSRQPKEDTSLDNIDEDIGKVLCTYNSAFPVKNDKNIKDTTVKIKIYQ